MVSHDVARPDMAYAWRGGSRRQDELRQMKRQRPSEVFICLPYPEELDGSSLHASRRSPRRTVHSSGSKANPAKPTGRTTCREWPFGFA
jgi:hypothetical protein